MRWQLKINTLIWFAAVFCIGNYLLIWLKLSLGRAFYGILASPILFFSTRYVLTGQNSHLSLISLRKKQRGDLLVFIIIHYYHYYYLLLLFIIIIIYLSDDWNSHLFLDETRCCPLCEFWVCIMKVK